MDKEMVVKYDCVTGLCKRYIVGAPGAPISGAIYVLADRPIPDRLILIFKPKGAEDGTKEG